VSEIVGRNPVAVRRPEKDTRPKLFYRGAHQATLDPLAAQRPEGGLFLWSQQGELPHQVYAGAPEGHNSAAAAMLSYDVPHRAPWDWRVSAYTWTKGIAAGAWLLPALLLLLGVITPANPLWRWAAPMLGGAFLAATGLLLIADLEHPTRFYYLFLRPQWRSWLVRGAVFISGYGAVLVAHFATSVLKIEGYDALIAWAGLPFALMTAIYTAWLFARSKGRDLWQSPLLPPHLAVQAIMVGAAALLFPAVELDPGLVPLLLKILAASTGLHLALVAGEVLMPHPTNHARLAAWEMTSGTYQGYFLSGLLLCAAAVAAPWLGAAAAPLALVGLLAHEHAYVQAGQIVPLA